MKNSSRNINTLANILAIYSDDNGIISFSKLHEVISNTIKISESEIQSFIQLLEEKNIITLITNNMVVGDINFKVKTIKEIRQLKINEIFDINE
jgi:hypothetical protein